MPATDTETLNATETADRFILALLEHQPGFVPGGTLSSEEACQKIARGIAALRKELVQKLLE